MKTRFKLLISIGTGVVCFGLSMFSHLLLLPFLALAGFMAAEWGAVYIIPALLGVAAGSLLPSGFSAGNYVTLAMLALVPIVLGVYGKKRFPHRNALLALAAILTVGLYLSMTLDSIVAGEAPYAEAVRLWNDASERTANFFSGVSGYAELMEVYSAASEFIPDALMPVSLLTGEALALGLLLIYRCICRLFRTTPAPMAKFYDWRLPRTAHWGSLFLLVLIPIGYIFRLNRANSIAISVGIIVLSLFALQGMSYLLYMFTVSGAPAGLKILTFVLVFLLFPYSLLFLTYFGVSEQIRNRRKLIREHLKELSRMDEAKRRADEINKYGYTRGDAKPDDVKKDDKEEE